MQKIRVDFSNIRVNSLKRDCNSENDLELILMQPLLGRTYTCPFTKAPYEFKITYILYLKLQGIPVPQFLKQYEKTFPITIESLTFLFNTADCKLVSENYPVDES